MQSLAGEGEAKTGADIETKRGPGPDHGHDEPISVMATICEANFKRSLNSMESKNADILQKLQAKFVNWAAYLDVFAVESAGLDRRLRRHQQYRDLVLLVLDTLNSSLLQTLAEPKDVESDSSSDGEVGRRQAELSGIQKSINELDRLAIYIRQSSTSPLDARAQAFGARKLAEVASFETLATLAVNGLYPEASEILRQRLSKSMTQRYTRLLYWRYYKKRADGRRRHEQPRDGLVQSKLNTPPASATEPPQQQQGLTNLDEPKPERLLYPIRRGFPTTRKRLPPFQPLGIHKGTSLLSGTVVSNTGSDLALPLPEGQMPQPRRTATTALQSGAKYPTPPKVEDGEDEKPCHYCRKNISKAELADFELWRKHVNGDLVPFVCVSSTCSEAPIFASRSEWIAHMEGDHDAFWSWRLGVPNPHGPEHAEPEAQAASGPSQLENLCPLCSLPLEKNEDVRTGFQRPTAAAANPFNSRQGTLPLGFEERDLNEPSGSSGNAKRSVRLEIRKRDSELAAESSSQLPAGTESMKAGDRGAQKAADRAMLNHIAEHLQFLTLLTLRLSTEKLADEDVSDFSSSRAISSDEAPRTRSALDDELETPEGINFDFLQENTLLEAESTQHPPETILDSASDSWHNVPAAFSKDKDENVQQAAAVVLGQQSALLSEGVAALIAFLKDNDSPMRQAAAVVLGQQSALSPKGIAALIAALKDKNWYMRWAAAEALGQQQIHNDEKDSQCLKDLYLTDPRDEKTRIEHSKAGLLQDAYRWILDNAEFRQWRGDEQRRLVWIKGAPGKGKTTLLCGLIDELKQRPAETGLLSFFFCQGTDSRRNNATAILRGLIYLLVDQQPSLLRHVRKQYDCVGKALFEDANAWEALSEVFIDILQDQSLKSAYLVIDAFDECVTDLPKLFDLIVGISFDLSSIKWIVSSCNWQNIEKQLRLDLQMRLSSELELNTAQISDAVDVYVSYCVDNFVVT